MRRRKIDQGNAADVIQRGRNVTIVPFEPETIGIESGVTRRSVALRYAALDIANGTAAPNPDLISVNLSAYPGWKIQEYSCAGGGTGTCPNYPASTTYVEILDMTADDWVDAWLLVEMQHAAIANANEYLFQVTAASIISDISTITPANVSRHYAAPGNVSTTSGVYLFQIATTVNNVRVMVASFNDPDQHENYYDTDYLEAHHADAAKKYTLTIDGYSLPEDRKLSLAAWDNEFRYLLEVVP